MGEYVTSYFGGASDFLVTLIAQVVSLIPRIAIGLVVLGIFWIIAILVQRSLRRILQRSDLNRDVEELMEQGVKIAFLGIGAITALDTMGVDIGGMVASLGLVGFAVGFALKDAISNMLAGVLLLAYHPFERGDCIMVAGQMGRVLDIDLRYTVLDTDAERIHVPNSQLLTNAVRVQKGDGSDGPPSGGET